MVSIPVRLFKAARRERVRLQYLRSAPVYAPAPVEAEAEGEGEEIQLEEQPPAQVERVRQEFVPAAQESPVSTEPFTSRQELVKGHEVAPEQYVVLSKDELRGLRRATSRDMEIVRTVELREIDPLYFDTSYYLAPDREGVRAYSLLYASLQSTGYAALAKVSMHGREQAIVIRPGPKGLIAHTMYYQDEIRVENEFHAAPAFSEKELDLARSFVQAIAGPFAPEEFKDTYREQLQNLISGKLDKRDVAAAAPAAESAKAPVTDILEALKKSLESVKKKPTPAASRRAAGKVTEIKGRSQRRKA